MPARIGRLSTGVGRSHPVTVPKASLMTKSMRRVSALRQQTGAQHSAVEWTRTDGAIRNVVVPVPQPGGKGEAANTDKFHDHAEYVSAR